MCSSLSTGAEMFPHLFSPITLGPVRLENRICFLAHRTNLAEDGRVSPRLSAYYARRAAGGCGLLILGEIAILPGDRPYEAMIAIQHPETQGDFRALADRIHGLGVRVFAQLGHRGFQSSGAISREPVWGPSALADIAHGETARAMEPEDMDALLGAFGAAARLVRQTGMDGIEIDMGPESLLRQFLSPLSNLREDAWGGCLDNRLRLPLAVMEAVRKAVGPDFTVGLRLCVDEMLPWGGLQIAESLDAAKRLTGGGLADFLDVTVGTYFNLHLVLASMHTPLGLTVEHARQVREAVGVPVMASYLLHSPERAEAVLAGGKADMAGFVRALVCDPDLPRKAREGKSRLIRHCVRDNKGCVGRTTQLRPIGCIQNPEAGRELEASCRPQAKGRAPRRVLVVGAGPAGLEAARAAAERGHEVLLYEKAGEPGGQISTIVKRPGRQAMAGVVSHLTRMLEALGVEIHRGVPMTEARVLAEDPDVVVVATGSRPVAHPVPGDYGPPSVLSVWEALTGDVPLAEEILFVDEDGGHHAAATVELLADQGKAVTLVTSDLFVGFELGPLGDLYLTRQRLLQKGVRFVTDILIDEIRGTRVLGKNRYTHAPVVFEGQGTIILDMGNAAEDSLYHRLKGKVRELHRVGDCVAPRGIDMAILEGRKVGEAL